MKYKKSRNDLIQKPSLSITSIQISMINSSIISNSTNSIDNISKSNTTIKVKNTINQIMLDISDSDLDTPSNRNLRIFNVISHSKQSNTFCFDNMNVIEFLY